MLTVHSTKQQGRSTDHPQNTVTSVAIEDVHHTKKVEWQTESGVLHLYTNRGTPSLAQAESWRTVAPLRYREVKSSEFL